MKTMDLNGREIEVTDLDKAIEITGGYKEYRYADKNFLAFDKKQKAYWTDMYEKLLKLKTAQDEQSRR
ncbi:hypothetical protein AS589_07865 [Empedobacter brevis]|uniref:hypothetical protein n=1 Tax=Empedobacter brevis TaxID=247 RepID=UPI00131F6C9B|nr:hypothetical protein [Empedobacter brevis]QHC84708.1 hypothetical protein AS589_07865 [Empedobacter brevis]